MRRKQLDFRALIMMYDDPCDKLGNFWSQDHWNEVLARTNEEHFNAVVWTGTNELWPPGSHRLLRHDEFPEARELRADENEAIIGQLKWILRCAK